MFMPILLFVELLCQEFLLLVNFLCDVYSKLPQHDVVTFSTR